MKIKILIIELEDDSKLICRSRRECVSKINSWIDNQNDSKKYNKLSINSLDNLIYNRIKNNRYSYIKQIYSGNIDKLIKIPNYTISYNDNNNRQYSKSYIEKKLNKERLTKYSKLTPNDFNLRLIDKHL
jgi:hypothetical protein